MTWRGLFGGRCVGVCGGRVLASVGGVPGAAVRAQLARIVASPGFRRAPRLRRFLAYAVEEALAGRLDRLKEYSLGVDVFDRGPDFDPKADPIVRVDARRLRERLAAYYATDGQHDAIEILFAKGGYQPLFRPRTAGGAGAARPHARLAVAPFEGEASDRYAHILAEGLTDELMLALGREPALQVVAAPRPPNGPEDLLVLAHESEAAMVLAGKVRREAGRVRVRAALTAVDGAQVWADRYDARLDEPEQIFRLQDDLATRIASLVAPQLAAAPSKARRTPTRDSQAYELYLRGCHQLDATRPDKAAEALSLLEAAATQDPGFSEAFAAIAELHFITAVFGLAEPMAALAGARVAATQALTADPGSAIGHAQLARVSAALDHDFAAARQRFDRALTLDPASPAIRHMRAMWLFAPLGGLDEALADMEACLDQKPYSRGLRVDYARLLTFARRFNEAARQLELVLEFEPDLPGGAWALAMAYEHAGDLVAARRMHERQVAQFRGRFPLVARWLEAAEALWAGERERARAVVEGMDRDAEVTPVTASVMTDAWLRLGEAGRAIGWLSRAAERRMLRTLHLAVDPDYARLQGEPAFQELLVRLHLRAG